LYFLVVKEIVNAANKIARDEDLSVSFIQVGHDKEATKFLKALDEDIKARFDIVDAVPADAMKGMTFEELITRSIQD